MSEITPDYIINFLSDIQPNSHSFIQDLEKYAHKKEIPIISFEVKSLLEFLLSMHQPNTILEIGTAIGYSSILMSQYLPKEGKIITIDRYPYMIEQAKYNIHKAKLNSVITLLEGNAQDILPTLKPYFDLIFLDAAKGQYQTFLPHCLRLLRPGGLLIADNVLYKGMIAKARYDIPRRQRTIHKRLRSFLWDISHHPELQTSILPIGDGVALSYKKDPIDSNLI
ncbi:MAG: O-methyltransferase [Epulopiscium sp.]|nr:O-methyltransferase [Candidatus Epulonipiscium sp.]